MMHAIAKKEAVVLAREHALDALNASLVLRNISLELPPCLPDDGGSAAPEEKEMLHEEKEEVEEKQEGKSPVFVTRFSWRLVWIVCLSLYVVFLIVFYFSRTFRY